MSKQWLADESAGVPASHLYKQCCDLSSSDLMPVFRDGRANFIERPRFSRKSHSDCTAAIPNEAGIPSNIFLDHVCYGMLWGIDMLVTSGLDSFVCSCSRKQNLCMRACMSVRMQALSVFVRNKNSGQCCATSRPDIKVCASDYSRNGSRSCAKNLIWWWWARNVRWTQKEKVDASSGTGLVHVNGIPKGVLIHMASHIVTAAPCSMDFLRYKLKKAFHPNWVRFILLYPSSGKCGSF
eukprot:895887-Amphidinium_carterae.1